MSAITPLGEDLDARQAALERAWRDWQPGTPLPYWGDFLPAAVQACTPDFVFLLIQTDIEFRIKAGQPALLIEPYFRHPRLDSPDAQVDSGRQLDLIRWEYQQRWQHGERASRSEYAARFPDHAAALQDLTPRWNCPRCRFKGAAFKDENATKERCPRCGTSFSVGDLFAASSGPGSVASSGRNLASTLALDRPEPTVSALDRVGKRIGPYRLQKCLGSGSFGEVWLAIREGGIAHTQLAVKLPHPSKINPQDIGQEARLWAQASNHPNVVPIFEAEVYDGQIVIASEYCPDGSLADWLRQHGGRRPSVDIAIDLILGILSGLEHLHRLGIVHRDIKPANVLLHQGVPRLADFGMSRLLPSTTEVPSGLAGTPAFMAPEAFDGVRSQATDIWAVGVLSYLLLTGNLPFPEREWTSVFKAIVTRDPAPLPDRVPASISSVVTLSLEKDPGRRLSSAAQMAQMLRAARSQTSVSQHPIRLAVHMAAFVGSARVGLFINATNLSPSLDREITHVWIETEPKIHVMNDDRPLPKRLKPQESWETWIELWRLGKDMWNDRLPRLVRARLSTGEVISGVRNQNVPEEGFIPGESPAEPAHIRDSGRDSTGRKARSWWRFW
jgi:serine/threonine protein kinase